MIHDVRVLGSGCWRLPLTSLSIILFGIHIFRNGLIKVVNLSTWLKVSRLLWILLPNSFNRLLKLNVNVSDNRSRGVGVNVYSINHAIGRIITFCHKLISGI
ncbi:hypothetical protein RRF57_007761 [Xylaria bambusicola]|uniref:Uncharacterized protein n=1 Tax=Xylaria bambusicola TaxID=326684 RepID=A0AAN7Z7R2_9PEZI